MGKRGKKSKAGKGKASTGRVGGRGVAPDPKAAEDLLTALASLPTMTAAATEEEGFGGDCPMCLETMPPFWDTDRLSFFPCCGESCCRECRDHVVDYARADVIEKVERQLRDKPEGLQVISFATKEDRAESEGLEVTTFDRECAPYNRCPFCQTRLYKKHYGGDHSRELKELLVKNTEKGYPWAQFVLGCAHTGGGHNRGENLVLGGVRDIRRGNKLLHLSAKQGYPRALFTLATKYYDGSDGIKKSVETAISLLKISAVQQGNAHASLHLYSHYEEQGDTEQAFKYIELSSKQGCGLCSCGVGIAYEDGLLGQKKDKEMALRYYMLGAEQGDDVAQFSTARLFYDLGDIEKEIEYLKMAAEQGYRDAQTHLGRTYVAHGKEWIKGQNWPSGIRWLRRARAAGCKDAAATLADIEKKTKSICFHCSRVKGSEESLSNCSRCRSVHYCSKKCQKEAWRAGHKESCVPHDE